MEPTDLVTQRAQARVGALLNGRWRLDKLVGVGGMAAVYAATHRNTKRVAIKILHAEISVDENARQRFLREGYAANQVGHRGAVAADDDGLTEDGLAFLVMELLEGETLEERGIRLGGTLEAREVLALMDQALATLAAAHERNIVHRDLKPENLFLTRDGVLKVLDFGIARLEDASGTPSQTRGVMGTPCFMAPEQARGRWQDVDARTDLWAIGATMFTLLSGRFVHQAETANETLVLAVTERASSLATVVAHAHPALVALVDKALAYERELRYQSAAEFSEALRVAHAALAGDESLPALAVPQSSQISRPSPNHSGVTLTEGVAASVRSARTELSSETKRRPKALLFVAALAAVSALGFTGTRLLTGESKRTAYAEPARAAAAALPSTPIPDALPEASSVVPKVSAAEVAAPPAATPILPTAAAKLARPAAIRGTNTLPVPASKPKVRPAKVTSDPFLKRH